MHIAICDDNVADRKHLERLLGRESDKRAGTPNLLYVDSYGDRDALLRSTPTMYDLLFIDLVETPTLTEETLRLLLETGVQAPVTLCSSHIDYTQITNLPEHIFHMNKPYKVKELEEILEKAQTIKDNKIPTLEMRSTEGTRYVTRDSIFYAYPGKENIHVFLTNGETFDIIGQPFEFYENFKPYYEFCSFHQTVLINMRYMKKKGLFSVTMNDGKKFSLSLSDMEYLYRKYKKYQKELQKQTL